MQTSWSFNEAVAERFDTEARTHIPDYEHVISLSRDLALARFPDRRARIIDVGSALGHTLEVFRDAGFTEVFGVDNSSAMLERSRIKENLVLSDVFPTDQGLFDVITANWTLHFVREPEARAAYIRNMYESLTPGGILVLSDKIDAGADAHAAYLDFKRSMGVSESEIRDKTDSLVGVLNTLPASWYSDTIRAAGCTRFEILNEKFCFLTLLCHRD